MNPSKENAAEAKAKVEAVLKTLPVRDDTGRKHLQFAAEFLAAAGTKLQPEAAFAAPPPAPKPETNAAESPAPKPSPPAAKKGDKPDAK